MWQVKRLSGSIGAEVTGLSLNNVTQDDIEKINALLHEHLVLFFPEQHLDQSSHVSLGHQFGKMEGHPNLGVPYPDHPEIFELVATSGGVADEWHTDITFQDQPAKMSILNMMKTPDVGGDTMWTSLYAAYDELSAPMKDLCENLTALHDALPHNKPELMTIHPVVRIHPVTKKKALYVNEHFTRRIVEMSASESNALLPFLTNWVTNPRFTVRYQWTEGTIGIWDNRCTQHFVLNDFSGERIIQRVTIMGDEVEGCSENRWEPWVRPGRLSATSRHDRQLFQYMNSKVNKGS
ncbi:MAG: taurine dioxygenase [Candidatus Azotimanducaceae bacterium]|jgi:taurine dioxygenase